MRIKYIIECLLAIPYSLWFCIRTLPLRKAIKLPVLISNVKIISYGNIQICGEGDFGRIKIGLNTVGICDKRYQRVVWDCKGDIFFEGRATIGPATKIVVSEKGSLRIGDNFNCTADSILICYDSIKFGDNCLVSWRTQIIDTDFHHITSQSTAGSTHQKCNSPIVIGDRVWIGSGAIILKGVNLPAGSVIGAGSVVTKSFNDPNILLAGNPAIVKKRNIIWTM